MISNYMPLPQVPIPENTTKLALGKIRLGFNKILIKFKNYLLF